MMAGHSGSSPNSYPPERVNGKIFHVAGGIVALAHEETPYRQIQREGKWTVEELM